MVLVSLLAVGCGVARAVDGRRCASAADCEQIHPAGIADPSSPDFHGQLVQSLGWNLGLCAQCHGADFSGGASGKSCLTCHAQGPTACTVCHAQPPATGAHVAHAAKYDCTVCHVKPAAWNDPGHLFASDGSVITSARITFGGLAVSHGATPSWDGASCSGTYCHGSAKPVWTGGAGQAACGSCHAIPPANHASSRCGDCHVRVANDQAQIVDDALHVDGQVSLGDDSGTCLACHPQPGGAHASHTQALHELRAPLGCPECHVVPTMLTSPGHIDQPSAPVFPAGWSGLGANDGAQPTWSLAAGQCSSVYCHGGGKTLGADAAATIIRQPTWIPGSGAASCGACHGIPPVDGAHSASMGLGDCATCHPTTMNAGGGLISGGTHMDGVIDAL